MGGFCAPKTINYSPRRTLFPIIGAVLCRTIRPKVNHQLIVTFCSRATAITIPTAGAPVHSRPPSTRQDKSVRRVRRRRPDHGILGPSLRMRIAVYKCFDGWRQGTIISPDSKVF